MALIGGIGSGKTTELAQSTSGGEGTETGQPGSLAAGHGGGGRGEPVRFPAARIARRARLPFWIFSKVGADHVMTAVSRAGTALSDEEREWLRAKPVGRELM